MWSSCRRPASPPSSASMLTPSRSRVAGSGLPGRTFFGSGAVLDFPGNTGRLATRFLLTNSVIPLGF